MLPVMLWGSRGAKVIDICVFRNGLSNIRTTLYVLFVAECLFYHLKPLVARVLLGKPRKKQTSDNKKLFTYSYVITIAAISNVEDKNIKSADCVGFTRLKRKLLQHLDDM